MALPALRLSKLGDQGTVLQVRAQKKGEEGMSESARDEALRLAREAGFDAIHENHPYGDNFMRLVSLARQRPGWTVIVHDAQIEDFFRVEQNMFKIARAIEQAVRKECEADAKDAARWRALLPKIAEHFAFNYLNLKDAVDATLRGENVL